MTSCQPGQRTCRERHDRDGRGGLLAGVHGAAAAPRRVSNGLGQVLREMAFGNPHVHEIMQLVVEKQVRYIHCTAGKDRTGVVMS